MHPFHRDVSSAGDRGDDPALRRRPGPAAHEEMLNTVGLSGRYVIPHFRAKEKRAAT
jgi:hypothetical protein